MSVAYDEPHQKTLPISPTEIGTVYSAFLLAYMLCMTPGGWLIDRWGTPRPSRSWASAWSSSAP